VSDVRQWVDLVGVEQYRCTEHKEAKMRKTSYSQQIPPKAPAPQMGAQCAQSAARWWGGGGGQGEPEKGGGQVTTHSSRRTAEDGKLKRGSRIPPRCAVP